MIAKRFADDTRDVSTRVSPEQLQQEAITNTYAFRGAPASAAQMDVTQAHVDRVSVFWRIFGGTILSICALAAVTIYNNLTNNIAEVRGELNRVQSELRTEIARANEARAELIKKDEFNSRMATVWDGIKTIQTQSTAGSTTLTTQKTELDAMKERLTRAITELDALRKESTMAVDNVRKEMTLINESSKKDMGSLESIRERLTQIANDAKALREESQKVRFDLDRNIAYDNERKLNRDQQSKLYDDAIKELQKSMQDCREKLARIEGQTNTNPMNPTPAPMPKKPSP